VRCNKIGFVVDALDNHLEFSAIVNKVVTHGGKVFALEKMMFHDAGMNVALKSKAIQNDLFCRNVPFWNRWAL